MQGATASMGVHEGGRVNQSKWGLRGEGVVVWRMCVEDGALSREAEQRRRHSGRRACELQTVREEKQRQAVRPNPLVPSQISQSTAARLLPPLAVARVWVPEAQARIHLFLVLQKVPPLSIWTWPDTHDPQPTVAYPLITVSREEMTSSDAGVGLLWVLEEDLMCVFQPVYWFCLLLSVAGTCIHVTVLSLLCDTYLTFSPDINTSVICLQSYFLLKKITLHWSCESPQQCVIIVPLVLDTAVVVGVVLCVTVRKLNSLTFTNIC